MIHEFTTRRRIEFVDTDMGGMVHFSRFLVFMETAEHEFLRSLGTSVTLEQDGKEIGWPRVAVSCEYRQPARYGDVLEIRLRVLRKGTKSMTYGFVFERDGTPIATGRSTAVCCELGPEVRAIPIPDVVAAKVEQAP